MLLGRLVESEWSDHPYATQKSDYSQLTHTCYSWWATHVESLDQECTTWGRRMLHVPNQHSHHEERTGMHFSSRWAEENKRKLVFPFCPAEVGPPFVSLIWEASETHPRENTFIPLNNCLFLIIIFMILEHWNSSKSRKRIHDSKHMSLLFVMLFSTFIKWDTSTLDCFCKARKKWPKCNPGD